MTKETHNCGPDFPGKARQLLNDRELLIRIDERVDALTTALKEHRARHWAVTLAAMSALGTAIVALVVAIASRAGVL